MGSGLKIRTALRNLVYASASHPALWPAPWTEFKGATGTMPW